jgi:hypothetical protein
MVDQSNPGKATTWNKRQKPDRFERVDAGGVYNFLVKEAWDSKFAPAGVPDVSKGEEARYLGISAVVVSGQSAAPTNQEGKYIRIWCRIVTDKDQDNALICFEALGIELDPNDEIEPDSGLSVVDFIGQYFKGKVTMRVPDGQTEEYANCAVWDMYIPDDKYVNNPKTLSIDEENTVSVQHYQDELDRIANRKKSDVPEIEDDDLPF